MRKAHNQISWGIVLTFLNSSIGYLNVLPNVIAYSFIDVELNNLYKETGFDPFNKLMAYTMVLTLSSFLAECVIWFTKRSKSMIHFNTSSSNH